MRFWLRSGAIAIALLLAAPVVALVGKATGSRSSTDWTALRFEQPELAATGLTADVSSTVAIAIDRHGGATSYVWTAEMRIGETTKTFASGDASVAANGSTALEIEVPRALATAGSRLYVSLDTGQRIDLRIADGQPEEPA